MGSGVIYTVFSRIFIQMCFFRFILYGCTSIHYLYRTIFWFALFFVEWCRFSVFLLNWFIHNSVHILSTPLCISYTLSTGVSFCFVYIRKIILHFLLVFRVFWGANSGQNGHFYNPVSSLYLAIHAAGCFDFVFFILSGWLFAYYREYQFTNFSC